MKTSGGGEIKGGEREGNLWVRDGNRRGQEMENNAPKSMVHQEFIMGRWWEEDENRVYGGREEVLKLRAQQGLQSAESEGKNMVQQGMQTVEREGKRIIQEGEEKLNQVKDKVVR
ncbi:MAG: hypothetical protein Q9218_000078 [Villophora microphyllina]